ncbi:MAG: sigma-70 family RNA polymerase sigma factor [Clostridia bacterium]|nr:sigma-70 family RNA polymerase sigma factor [Clostridia bacterium]
MTRNGSDNLTDQELLTAYRGGDKQAFETLYRRYEQMVKSIARPYSFVGISVEDLSQEGFLGLYDAVSQFDENNESEASFKTFAYACVRNRILNVIRLEGGDRRKALNVSESLDPLLNNSFSVEEDVFAEKSRQELLFAIRNSLSEMEKAVFDYYVAGYKCSEIAEFMNLSEKSIDNTLQRIKTKSRKLFSV